MFDLKFVNENFQSNKNSKEYYSDSITAFKFLLTNLSLQTPFVSIIKQEVCLRLL